MKIYCIPAKNFLYTEGDNSKEILQLIDSFCDKNDLDLPEYNNDSTIIIAKELDEVVGFLQVYQYLNNKEFYIAWVMVKESYRGHGIYKKMFKKLKMLAQLHDIHFVTAHVLKSNFIPNAVHRKLNFIQADHSCVKMPLALSQNFNSYTYIMEV